MNRIEKIVLLWALVVLAGVLIVMLPASGQTTPYWFSVTNGDTTCRAFTVQPSPFRFSYLCENPRGAVGGSYTAVGNTTMDSITVGLSPTSSGGGLCQFVVNTTAVNASIGSFGTVLANSVAWQCNTQAVGSTPIGSPAVPPSAAIKGK